MDLDRIRGDLLASSCDVAPGRGGQVCAPGPPSSSVHVEGLSGAAGALTGLWPWAAGAVVLTLLMVVALLHLRRRPVTGRTGPGPAPVDGDADLLQALFGVFDLSDSPAVQAHVVKTLRAAGVSEIQPRPGDAFDTRVHNGLTWQPAPSGDLHLRVARVIRTGWTSGRSGVLRPADVEVYKDVQ